MHSVQFLVLAHWFEQILGGQVIDETGLPGIYGFELKQRVNTPEAFIQLLRDEAGLVITREERETPTLVVGNEKQRPNDWRRVQNDVSKTRGDPRGIARTGVRSGSDNALWSSACRQKSRAFTNSEKPVNRVRSPQPAI